MEVFCELLTFTYAFYIQYNKPFMTTCVIIDDERNARGAFLKIVNRYFKDKLKVLSDTGSVAKGVAAIYKYNPDIVFLDIEMPDENGFKLFEYFDELNFEVIFTTAFNKYAVDAIKFSALDYLLKPINYIDLNDALKKFNKKDEAKMRRERVELLLSNMNMGNSIKSKVALPTLTGYRMKKINDIIYCEGDHNYTNIHLVNNESLLVSKTLKFIEELLPEEIFFRIHKSYLINLNYVEQYSRTDGHLVHLDNGKRLEIASRRIEDFINAITTNSFSHSSGKLI
jgi:two-component system LytT family response regulator